MNNLNKIINLIKKTGDKFVVLDEYGESFVIMPLHDYERMVEGEGRSDYGRMSEKELFDSVERDIALWRAEHEDYEDYDKYGDYDKLEPEPWEMEPFGEAQDLRRKPLPFGDEEPLPWEKEPWESFDEVQDLRHEPLPWEEWEENEMPAITEDTEETLRTQKGFQSPQRDSEPSVFAGEPIKYEDIPPPPSVDISDIIDDEKKKEEIIDMSFEDEESDFGADKDEDEDDFMEESVF